MSALKEATELGGRAWAPVPVGQDLGLQDLGLSTAMLLVIICSHRETTVLSWAGGTTGP